MPLRVLTDRLARHSVLSPGDVAGLGDLDGEQRSLTAGAFAVREGADTHTCTVLTSGIAMSHKIVGNGGRQILGIYLPGELLDFDGLFLRRIDYNVQAIAPCEVTVFSCENLLDLSFRRAAIGTALLREAMIRSAITREWMVNLGRRDSITRVAHLFCELSLRLAWFGGNSRAGFELPINQEQISDIIGITPMHVGRVLKDLEADGLIERNKRTIRIFDWDRLASTGDFSPEYLQLPPA